MAVSNTKAFFTSNVQKVWDTVTSIENYEWRSDLGKAEKLDDKRFVEYTKDGYATTFTITVMETCRRWEFDMENDNIKGHWTGIFSEESDGTEIDFTEEVKAKKFYMIPFVKSFLKAQQEQYIADLRKALS